jgi:hypothetical protein
MKELRERAEWYQNYRHKTILKTKFYLWLDDSLKLQKVRSFTTNVINHKIKQNVFDSLLKNRDEKIIELSK